MQSTFRASSVHISIILSTAHNLNRKSANKNFITAEKHGIFFPKSIHSKKIVAYYIQNANKSHLVAQQSTLVLENVFFFFLLLKALSSVVCRKQMMH